MAAKFQLFLICSFAFLITTYAGTWDSFELGLSYADDPGLCYHPTHGIDMIMTMEYQVPGACETMICHDTYIISARKLEFDKIYQPVGRCGVLKCDKKFNMTVEACPVKTNNNPYCVITDEDLTKPFPKCCPDIKCGKD